MKRLLRHPIWLALWLAGVWVACTSSAVLEPVDTSASRIAALSAQIEADSSHTEALRNLGIIYVEQEQFSQAIPLLEKAFALDPEDLYTRAYFGLALEHTGQLNAALDLYAQYRALPRRSRFRRLLAGRHEATSRKRVQRDMAARVAAEDSLLGIPLDVEALPLTVAVFPFTIQDGVDSRYAPLGRGLSTLLLRDLAQVERLTVLERLRMDVLLDELTLPERGIVDPGTAPRVGRLLRARRVIGGGFSVSDEEHLRLNVLMREVVSDETKDVSLDDPLSQFFALEKDLVFDLIAGMGIELSEAEREKIDFIPTQNLQAFLAYSRGLQAVDAGRYVEASGFFQQALALDPGFSMATDEAQSNEELLAGNENLGIPPDNERESLLIERQQSLSENVRTLFLPGEDRRDESPRGSISIERPPDPPPPGGN